MIITLERDEAVENWMVFRDAFEAAAEKVGMRVSQIVDRNSKREIEIFLARQP